MKDYLIYMDASGDVDAEIAAEAGVKILPMNILVGDEETVCDGKASEKDLEAFYAGISEGKILRTSQISPYAYEESFAPILESGVTVLYLCLSSGLSSTYLSAVEAAENLSKKYEAKLIPVDSRSATGGMGIILERIIANKKSGMTAEQNAADIEAFRKKVFMNCFVDDLMHLKRGGRIGATKAVVGKLLGIKPLILITEEGKLENYSKARGEKKAMAAMSEVYASDRDENASDAVYIIDSENRPAATALAEMIRAINPEAVVRHKTLSPVIGVHLGPGAVVLCFVKK